MTLARPCCFRRRPTRMSCSADRIGHGRAVTGTGGMAGHGGREVADGRWDPCKAVVRVDVAVEG